MPEEELIVLLDDHYQPIGSAPKLSSHHANTPLHLAFSCYIFNDKNELLVTQRADSKKVWPGVWTNSVCGHPAPNEAMIDAIKRRAAFELGMTEISDVKEILGDYVYKTPPFNGIVENEFCPVYFAHTTQQPTPNPAEVSNFHWQSIDDLRKAMMRAPDGYSFWLKDQLNRLPL